MAINKSSTEYYNLEKVAEVLSVPTAEVNRLREQNKLRGFRDGSNWKFNKEEVHTYLAETIKSRGSSANGHKASDSGFDLASDVVGGGSPSSFDLLVEDAALPDDSDLISVTSAQSKSELDLASLDNNEDDLLLAEETQISSLVVPKKAKAPEPQVPEDDELGLSEATQISSLVVPKKSKSKSATDDFDSEALIMASGNEDSVLGGGGSSPQISLTSDSGFDVLVAGEDGVSDEDGDLLLVAGENTNMPFIAAEEFVLEPSPKQQDDGDSESSSQVMAIDVGTVEAAHGFAQPEGEHFDFIGFDSGVSVAPSSATATNDPFGFGAVLAPEPFGIVEKPTVVPKKTVVAEQEYSTGVLISLVVALAMMMLPGMMLIDTMVHIWSWGTPFVLNSILMSTIGGWFGL